MRVRSRFKKRFNDIALKYFPSDELHRSLISSISPRKFSNMLDVRKKKGYYDDSRRKYRKEYVCSNDNYVLYSNFDATSLLSRRGRISVEYYRHSNVNRSRVKDIMEGYTIIDVSTLVAKLNLNKNTTHRDLQNYNYRMQIMGDVVCSGIIPRTKGKLK